MQGAWVLVLALAVSMGAGCSCGAAHELDDAAIPDDAPRVDAAADDAATMDAAPADDAFSPDEHFFTLEPAVVDLIVMLERCAENEGAAAIVRVAVHYFSSCDSPGPIDVSIDASARVVTITPHVWLEHGRTDCASVGAEYQRDVPIVGLTAGTWTITHAFTSLPYTVSAMPPVTCTTLGTRVAGDVCSADCECTPGLSCLAVRGDAACQRQCADPCETLGLGSDLSLSCASGDACDNDPNLGWTCASSSIDECDDTHPCPAGMNCPAVSEGPRQCAWAIALNGAIRHACTTESECDAGLDCVQRADGQRACEVRCSTSDMACPNNAPHACLTGSWICEWLGE